MRKLYVKYKVWCGVDPRATAIIDLMTIGLILAVAVAFGFSLIGCVDEEGNLLDLEGVAKVYWINSPVLSVSDLNRMSTLDWTELDLSDKVSEGAEFVFLQVRVKADTVGTGTHICVAVKKNGTEPQYYPEKILDKAGTTAGVWKFKDCVVGVDEDKKLEYRIYITTGWQLDTQLLVLGYIEGVR